MVKTNNQVRLSKVNRFYFLCWWLQLAGDSLLGIDEVVTCWVSSWKSARAGQSLGNVHLFIDIPISLSGFPQATPSYGLGVSVYSMAYGMVIPMTNICSSRFEVTRSM